MKLTAEQIEKIVDVIDPLCRTRYKEGQCLPRGYETSTAEKVNRDQELRERAAIAKARKIRRIIEGL